MNKATFWGWFMVNYKGIYDPPMMYLEWEAVEKWLKTVPLYPYSQAIRQHSQKGRGIE